MTAVCALTNAVAGGLGWSVVPPLLGVIGADIGLSHASSGFVWGAAPLGSALAAPLGGMLVDGLGPRRVGALALLAGAAACAARAAVHGPAGMALVMFAFGVHAGFGAPAVPKALAAHVPADRVARANGLAVLAYTLTSAAMILVARGVLLPLLGGWRAVMLAVSAVMALAAVLWALGIPEGHAGLVRHAGLADMASLVRNRALGLLAFMQFLSLGVYLALLGLLPLALVEGGLSLDHAGMTVAAWLVAAALASAAGPWASDRIGRRRPFLLGGTAVSGAALCAMALLPPGASSGLLLLAALGGGCFAPLLIVLPLEIPGVGAPRAGAAAGLLMLVGLFGGFLFPVATGWAFQLGGFPGALGFLGIAQLGVLIPAAAFPETGRAARAAVLREVGLLP